MDQNTRCQHLLSDLFPKSTDAETKIRETLQTFQFFSIAYRKEQIEQYYYHFHSLPSQESRLTSPTRSKEDHH